ncbi:hypothetical protein ACK3TF_001365 [Chlorella vulgaris]
MPHIEILHVVADLQVLSHVALAWRGGRGGKGVSMAKNSPSSMRVASPPLTIGTLLPPWMRYGAMEWPLRLRIAFTWCTLPSSSTSRTSMPLSRTPVLVASRTASSRGLYRGLKATVKALSMMRPLIWRHPPSFMTSSYCSTVLSPLLGVQEQPVGKAMPASRPLASMRVRTDERGPGGWGWVGVGGASRGEAGGRGRTRTVWGYA